jgi:hypothetical protein
MTTATATTWAGWYRPSKRNPWRRVTAALPTEAEAQVALLDALRRLPSGMSTVVAGDEPPAEKKAR